MSDDRRYSDAEVAIILERASAAPELPSRASAGTEGMTLAQLQEIGVEVGIAPEVMARAAGAVARGDLVPTKQLKYAGLPVGVTRTINFGRTISDDEWDRLVVLLRETFAARGRTWREGGLRQWQNGNLQALLEPTVNGHRLVLKTRKGNAMMLLQLGAVGLIGAVGLTLMLVLSGKSDLPFWVPAAWAGWGAVAIGAAALQLPPWARLRASQMESIAARTAEPPTG